MLMETNYFLELLGELNKKYKELDAIYHSLALQFGISDTSFWILYILSETNDSITQYSLCNEWNYSKQTINSAISSLEKVGYVSKKETFDSRNRKIIVLTSKGKEFIKKTIELVKIAELHALMNLTKEECAELLQLNDKYLQLFCKEAKQLNRSSED